MLSSTQNSKPKTQNPLTAIILAAGESRRTATLGPKQLLAWQHGRTILQAVLDNLAAANLPLQEALVILGSRAGEIVPTLSKEQWAQLPLRVMVNEIWQVGMLSSVQRGLAMSAPAAGYVILLGDQPNIAPATIRTIAAAYYADGAARPTLPTVNDSEGHPLIIPATLRDKIITADVSTRGGLRALLGDDILRVQLADAAVIWDIDTPEDYKQHL